MGSLLVKTYRVDRIFRNKEIGFALPDLQLAGYIILIELVEVAFLLVSIASIEVVRFGHGYLLSSA